MRVLVTRPQREATRFAADLAARGHDAVLAPLFSIAALPVPADFEARTRSCQAILLTSANGAGALAAATTLRSRPVYAVGQATAAAAEGLGFASVFSADGDGAALAAMVRRTLKPSDGTLLHVSGEDVAVDLAGLLAPQGFVVDRIELYAARAVEQLPEAASVALATETLDAVTFFSPRAAETFASLVDRARLGERLRTISAVAISPAALAPVAALGWRRSFVASAPTQAALLDALKQAEPTPMPVATAIQKEAPMSQASRADDVARASAPAPGSEAVATERQASTTAQTAPVAAARPVRRGLGFFGAFTSGLLGAACLLAVALGVARLRPELVTLALGGSTAPTAPAATTAPALDPSAITAAIKAELTAHAAAQASELAGRLQQAMARLDAVQNQAATAIAAHEARLAAELQAQSGNLAGLRESLAALQRSVGEQAARLEKANPLAADAQSLREAQAAALRELQALQASMVQLQTQAVALDNRLRQAGQQSLQTLGDELAPLKSRLERVEAEAQALAKSVAAAGERAAQAADRSALEREFARLRDELDRQIAGLRDLGQSATRRVEASEAELRQKLEQLVSVRGENDRQAGNRARAALALALAARLRQQIASGSGFESELDIFKPLAQQDPRFAEILQSLRPHAASGVVSLAQLAQSLPAMAKAALAADQADDSLGERALGAIKGLVSVRRVGSDVAGDSVEARLARAEAALENGNLQAAVALIRTLKGKPGEAAAAWLARAEAHLATQAVLDRLTGLAATLLGSTP